MMVKVLVTGAKGQLGQTIQQLFGFQEGSIVFTYVSKKELDITNKREVDSFFNQHKFDYCINCAAYTNVEEAEKTPEIAFKVNAEGVKYLAESCLKNKITLIHISTDYVFDGKKNEPYTEDDVPNPINEYGKSKRLGEQYIQETLSDYFIIRTSWLYSKEFGHNFYKTIISKSKTEKELFITDAETGCPTNTINLAHFIFDLIVKNNNNYGIKHFCDSEEMTWYDFAKSILIEENTLEKINLVKVKKYLTFAKRPPRSVLLNSK